MKKIFNKNTQFIWGILLSVFSLLIAYLIVKLLFIKFYIDDCGIVSLSNYPLQQLRIILYCIICLIGILLIILSSVRKRSKLLAIISISIFSLWQINAFSLLKQTGGMNPCSSAICTNCNNSDSCDCLYYVDETACPITCSNIKD